MKGITPRISPYVVIALLGILLFTPFLGQVHLFDWDEINFAESAREMLLTGDYGRVTINFQPFWEKPPLFIWMQVLSMKVFGVNEFAARFPNALCGIATLMVLFHYGRKYRDASFGWLWVLVYVGTWLPHVYFKSGIIDPVFNLFIFLGMLHLAQWADVAERNRQLKYAAFTGLFLGLAVLTKGPVGLLLPGFAAFIWMAVRRKWFIKLWPQLLGALVFLAVSFAWYGMETIRNGWWFLGEFLEYNLRLAQTEDSGHGGPFYYHFVVLLLGCFPASILLFYQPKTAPQPSETQTPSLRDLRLWMWILLGVTLLVFSIVQTKIIHYSSLAYFPITFLAASVLYRWKDEFLKVPKTLVVGIAAGVFVFGLALVGGTLFMSTDWGWGVVQNAVGVSGAVLQGSPWPLSFMLIGLLFVAIAVIGVRYMWVGRLFSGAVWVLLATAFTTNVAYLTLLPHVEPISQGSMIEFLKLQSKEDVYINVLGFKSFAHYYYGNKQLKDLESPNFLNMLTEHKQKHQLARLTPTEFNDLERWWHLEGNIDKPVVFVVRAIKAERIQHENPQLKRIGGSGGYVFLKREP